jgi:hypothetical protein
MRHVRVSHPGDVRIYRLRVKEGTSTKCSTLNTKRVHLLSGMIHATSNQMHVLSLSARNVLYGHG